MAERIYRTARGLFDQVPQGAAYRLLGVGLSALGPDTGAPDGDLLDPDAARRAGAERAADAIRAKFGEAAILRGRALR
jgi:DNA polymerase-4